MMSHYNRTVEVKVILYLSIEEIQKTSVSLWGLSFDFKAPYSNTYTTFIGINGA